MITFSNPRLEDVIPNWPLGGTKRGDCTFKTESKTVKSSGKTLYRMTKQTTGKAKPFTYAKRVCIVDGSDDKIWILEEGEYGGVSIHCHDHMSPSKEEFPEHYFSEPTKENESGKLNRYHEILQLINQAYATSTAVSL